MEVVFQAVSVNADCLNSEWGEVKLVYLGNLFISSVFGLEVFCSFLLYLSGPPEVGFGRQLALVW